MTNIPYIVYIVYTVRTYREERWIPVLIILFRGGYYLREGNHRGAIPPLLWPSWLNVYSQVLSFCHAFGSYNPKANVPRDTTKHEEKRGRKATKRKNNQR